MNKTILILPFLLTGCLPQDRPEPAPAPTPTACFEMTQSKYPPNQNILLDKCTGDSWILLRVDAVQSDPKKAPNFSYGWFKIQRTGIFNVLEGQ